MTWRETILYYSKIGDGQIVYNVGDTSGQKQLIKCLGRLQF